MMNTLFAEERDLTRARIESFLMGVTSIEDMPTAPGLTDAGDELPALLTEDNRASHSTAPPQTAHTSGTRMVPEAPLPDAPDGPRRTWYLAGAVVLLIAAVVAWFFALRPG